MKIIVYGSNGWIGKQFIELLTKNSVNYFEGKSRVDNEEDVIMEINNYNPTHIVSFIGRTHGENCNSIAYLEQKDKLMENIRDNLYGPFVLAEISRRYNIHFTYLGTGGIFKNEMGDDYLFREKDKPNFFGTNYSVVKGFIDRMMNFYKNVLNLRISMPISSHSHPRNFITKLIKYDKICNTSNSLTVLDELLPYILKMMKLKTVGTINMTNPGTITHNEILDMYNSIVDNSFEYKNFSGLEQNQKTASNHLNTERLTTMFPEIKDVKTSIRECLTKYN